MGVDGARSAFAENSKVVSKAALQAIVDQLVKKCESADV
jgi:hypothetical protein